MSRVLLRTVDSAKIEDQFKILTYDGYWSRVMFHKSQKRLTHRQIWEQLEKELAQFNTYAYISYVSFKKAIERYINKQKNIAIDPEDYDCRLFNYKGYWEVVMETRQNTDLSIEQIWKKLEDNLERLGLGRYKTFTSFTTHYSNYTKSKLKK